MSELHKDEASKKDEKQAFYNRLQEELNKNANWPMKYMYKFIVPNIEKIAQNVSDKFPDNVKLNKNYSRSGKYISITIITTEKNSGDIINRYKSMEDIEGLISL